MVRVGFGWSRTATARHVSSVHRPDTAQGTRPTRCSAQPRPIRLIDLRQRSESISRHNVAAKRIGERLGYTGSSRHEAHYRGRVWDQVW